MKKISPLVILLFAGYLLDAQPIHKKYFDKSGKEVDEEHGYAYKLIDDSVSKEDQSKMVETFYFVKNNKVLSQNSPNSPERNYIEYYENGGVKKITRFDQVSKIERLTHFYPNAKVQEISLYPEEWGQISKWRDYDNLILSYWDSAGVQSVIDGTGFCKRYSINRDSMNVHHEEGNLVKGRRNSDWYTYGGGDTLIYKETFLDGEFQRGIWYDNGKEIPYEKVEVQPEFHGGLEGLSQFLTANLRYPKDARRSGAQGKVFVQFVVEKDGSIADVQIIKGVSRSVDEEAMRVVTIMPKWSPGMQRGKIVKARFVLPIRFNLTR